MTEREKELAELLAEIDQVEAAVQAAVRDALIVHKAFGNPVASWENDRVILIPPDQIQIPDEIKMPNGDHS